VSRRSAGPLWWAVPLVALWSNFHVECLFGVVLLAVFAASELIWPRRLPRAEARSALMVTAAAAAATLANPYGWGLWPYLYENLSVQRVVAIAELLPPSWPAYRAFYAYLVLTALLLIARGRSLALSDAAVFLVFGVFGLLHLRETPLVLLVSAPFAAHGLTALTARGVDYRAIVVTAFCAGLALSRIPPPVLVRALTVGRTAVEPPQFFSRDAIDFATRSGLSGPVFNSVNLGGYLEWTMYPTARVFQDTRFQAYPPEHFRIGSSPEWTGRWCRRPGRTSFQGRGGFRCRNGAASFRTTPWKSSYGAPANLAP
jgi:hypothetical protein